MDTALTIKKRNLLMNLKNASNAFITQYNVKYMEAKNNRGYQKPQQQQQQQPQQQSKTF